MFSTYHSQGHTVLCEYGPKTIAFTNIELHYVMKDKGRQKYHQICSFDAKIGHIHVHLCVCICHQHCIGLGFKNLLCV